jgi:hypothetical protein
MLRWLKPYEALGSYRNRDFDEWFLFRVGNYWTRNGAIKAVARFMADHCGGATSNEYAEAVDNPEMIVRDGYWTVQIRRRGDDGVRPKCRPVR